jgi:hypothetical protein
MLGKEPDDHFAHLAQRRLHGAANDLGIHTVVVMSEQVTQPRDLLPRNLWLPREQVRGQRPDGGGQHGGYGPGGQRARAIPQPRKGRL